MGNSAQMITRVPALIEYARSVIETPTATAVPKVEKANRVKDQPKGKENKKSNISAADQPDTSAADQPDTSADFSPTGEDFFTTKSKKPQTPLQASARFPLFGDQKYYFGRASREESRNVRHERGSKEETSAARNSTEATRKICQEVWVFGPFKERSDAAPFKKTITRLLASSGITIVRFENHDESMMDTFEIIIPDKGTKVAKQTKKWDLSSEQSNALHSEVENDMEKLIRMVCSSHYIPLKNIFSSNFLLREIEIKVVPKKVAATEDDSDDDAVYDSDEEEDEIIITRTIQLSSQFPSNVGGGGSSS